MLILKESKDYILNNKLLEKTLLDINEPVMRNILLADQFLNESFLINTNK